MKVITYQDDRGNTLNLSQRQVGKLRAAGVWPKSVVGVEYCVVKKGLHHGQPSHTDADLAELCGVASL